MEAVAYLANEPWSDRPRCASPVISVFLRSYNDLASDEVRQTLKPFIPRLVGSASTPEVEDRRAFMAIDWVIRVHVPACLRLAYLHVQADALVNLPEITGLSQIHSIIKPLQEASQAAMAAKIGADKRNWAAARDASWAVECALRLAHALADHAWSAVTSGIFEAASGAATWDDSCGALPATVEQVWASTADLIERMIAVGQ